MTVQESTICSLIQAFPVLLIMTQSRNKCLKTPLIYKPPTPTPSPEYYEALDALFHNLYGHGHDEDHSYHGHHGCNGHHQYDYGKKWNVDHQGPYGHGTSCYGYGYPHTSNGHPGYGQSGYGNHGHGYSGYPSYGYKKVNIYNLTGGGHGYKGNYAPSQVYNMNHNHKYKVVVRKNKIGPVKRRNQKLRDETCNTVAGEVGSCISVFECEPYLTMLQQSRTNPALVQVLRKAHCGFEGNNPKVCCPRPGIPNLSPTTPTTTTTTTIAPAPAEGKSIADDDFVTALPEPPVCGVSNASFSRVVGGIDAKLGDFPWMALLGYMNKRLQTTKWLCGGALVTSKHILTAAHCIHGHEIDLHLVRLGELDLAREDDGATPVDVLIKTKIKHEEYSPNAYTNDIGILVLQRHVQFTDLIKPICIPRDSELRARSFENYNPLIAGWGDIEFRGPSATHLQVLQLPVVTNDFCAQAYSAYKAQTIDERVLCAGYKKGGKDACQGDSGGPLMQPIWNSKTFTTYFYQIGVVSYGKKCAEAGFPGVYTRVTHFVPWIEKTILGAA